MEISISDSLLQAEPWGAFALPRLAPEIPINIHLEDGKRMVARFILASERAGLKIPKAKGRTLFEVMAKQWEPYVAGVNKETKFTEAHLNLAVSGESLTFTIEGCHVINTFRMKPLVEKLEAIKPGLGWHIVNLVSFRSRNGLRVVTPSIYGYFAGRFELDDGQTESDLIKNMLEEYGFDEEFDEGKIPEYKEMLSDYVSMWPEDASEMVDGHDHLLCDGRKNVKQPKKIGEKDISKLLRQVDLSADVRELLVHVQELEAAFKRQGEESHPGDGDIHPCALLAWDDPQPLLTLADQYYNDSFESGTHTYDQAVSQIEADSSDEELERFVKMIFNHMESRIALAKVMRFFEQI